MDDLSGVDVDVMGAMATQLMRTNPALARRVMSQGRGPARFQAPAAPQLPATSVQAATLRSFMGLGLLATGGPAVWAPADAADKILQAEPQESFEGKRLIIDVAKTSGATGLLTTVRSLFIGSQPQSPVVDIATTTAMFASDATSADLDLQIAYRANKVTLTLSISAAPGSADSVTAAAGLYGNWIRGS
jgi:hypothetical protein